MEHSGRGRGLEAFVSGDVVIIDFPFSDFQHVKRRPALVLCVLHRDLLIAQITSRTHRDNCSIPLDTQDFLEGGLQFPSFIRADFLITCAQSLVRYKIGRVKARKRFEVVELVCVMLRGHM